MPKITDADIQDVARIDLAVFHLREARRLLKEAKAQKSLARAKHALKSAEGARRHVHHRLRRSS